MVAVSDFSGFWSSICALASAPAIAPMVSLERCMTGLQLHEGKTDRTRFGALGPDAMPDRLLSILRHQLLQLGFRGLMIEESPAGRTKAPGQFRPGIGRRHIDDPDRLHPGPWRLDSEQMRGLASLDAAPELLLSRQQEVLVERIAGNGHLTLLIPAKPAHRNEMMSPAVTE